MVRTTKPCQVVYAVLPAVCPRCQRNNAPTRTACLYCGARMPNPVAPSPEKPPAPENLDELIRRALTGAGSAGAVRAALSARPAPEPEPPPPSRAAPPEPAESRGDAGPSTLLLPGLAEAARSAYTRQDASGWRLALARLDEALQHARLDPPPAAAPRPPPPGTRSPVVPSVEHRPDPPASAPLAPAEAPLTVRLPPVRLPWILLMDGADRPELAPRLAEALEVDLFTARLYSAGRFARVVGRSPLDSQLRRRAAAIEALGLRASVISRAALEASPIARFVVEALGGSTWRVLDEPVWEEDIEPETHGGGEPIEVAAPLVVVPGEVEVRRRGQRQVARRLRDRYLADGPTTESRVGVIDLHFPTMILRIVEGLSRLDALPGSTPGAGARSFRSLLNSLDTHFPDSHVEARRVISSGPARDAAGVESGWPAWEEHSRLLREHRGPKSA